MFKKISLFAGLSFLLICLNGCMTEQQAYAPVVHVDQGKPFCGLACYSHNPQGIYKLSSEPYLEGVILVPGNYDMHICKPTGYETTDLTTLPKFKKLCDMQIKGCEIAKRTTGDGCWADSKTGNLTVVPQ